MNTKNEIIQINKKIAARCQIDTAVGLFFENKDLISIISLSHSAWGIIKNMLSAEHDSVRQALADNHIQKFGGTDRDAWEKVDELWNFIKHAKEDALLAYQFPRGYEEILLFSVIHDYVQLFSDLTPYMQIYYFWWVAKNQAAIPDLDKNKAIAILGQANELFPELSKNTSIDAQKKLGYDALKKLARKQKAA